MQINKITSYAADATKKLGKTILNNKPEGAALSKGLNKVNDFFQGKSYNPGQGAYYVLMGGFVIAPRLLQAREPDEFREILTRDVTTVLTLLFAMKGLKSGMCSAAQKKAGLSLVKDSVGKDAGKFKRLLGYLNPNGGITALDSKQIISKYSGINSKDALVNTLTTLDKEGGSVAKMFSVEKQKSVLGQKVSEGVKKLTEKLPFASKKSENAPSLYDAAVKMFGEGFETKTNSELIDKVKNITPNSKSAFEGLEDVIGSKAVNKTDGVIKKGILNDVKNNPVTNYARGIAADFETLSLALTAGFLGFGLPKINEKLTMERHSNEVKPKTSDVQNTASAPSSAMSLNNQIYQSIKANNSQAYTKFIKNA